SKRSWRSVMPTPRISRSSSPRRRGLRRRDSGRHHAKRALASACEPRHPRWHALGSAYVAVDDVLVQLLLAAALLRFTAGVADLGELLERQPALLELLALAGIEGGVALLAHLLER